MMIDRPLSGGRSVSPASEEKVVGLCGSSQVMDREWAVNRGMPTEFFCA